MQPLTIPVKVEITPRPWWVFTQLALMALLFGAIVGAACGIFFGVFVVIARAIGGFN